MSLSSCDSTDTTLQSGTNASSSSTEATLNRDTELYGKWIYVNSGEEFFIYSNSTIEYDKVDNSLIKVKESDESYKYAMRAGTSSARAEGKIQLIANSASRAINNIGNINVILENISDPNITSSVQSDSNGNFKSSTLPVGDYTLTIDDIEENITVVDEKEELGTYNIVDGEVNNFKISLSLDEAYLYANGENHNGKIIIENISEITAVGLSYTIELQNKDLGELTKTIVLGSIAPKAFKEIPITLKFDTLDSETEDIAIDVTIKDINGLTWSETLHVNVYKKQFYLNIKAKSANIKGYVILPFSDKVVKIDLAEGNIALPMIDKDYKILLSNPSIEEESIYSIGIQRSAVISDTFNNPAEYEPNDKLEDANTLESGDIIDSYMHVGDLDYWIVHVRSEYKPTNPTQYEEIVQSGGYAPPEEFYYVSFSQDTNIIITGGGTLLDGVVFYTLSKVKLGTISGAKLIPAGEYLIKPASNSNFSIQSLALDTKN